MFFQKIRGWVHSFFLRYSHTLNTHTRDEDDDEYDVRQWSPTRKTIRVRENVRVRRRRGFYNFGVDTNLHFYDAIETESNEKVWKFRPLRGVVFVSRRV